MAKETVQSSFNVNLEDFVNKLSSDTSTRKNPYERYNLAMPNEKGNYFYLLFPDKNSFYKSLNRVKELKAFSSKLSKDVWFSILEKSDYGKLTEEEAKLYDEVIRLYAQVEKIDSNLEDWTKKRTRTKSYCLVYAHVIKFINHDNGMVDKDKVNKPAMLIFPSKKFLEAFNQVMVTKNSIMGNNNWLSRVLSVDPKKRDAIITTEFFGGKGGYTCTVSFELDKDVVKSMLPDNYDFTSELDYFMNSDITKEYLRWQASEEDGKIFSTELFQELRLRLIDMINPVVEQPAASQPVTTSTAVPTSTVEASKSTMETLTSDSSENLPF